MYEEDYDTLLDAAENGCKDTYEYLISEECLKKAIKQSGRGYWLSHRVQSDPSWCNASVSSMIGGMSANAGIAGIRQQFVIKWENMNEQILSDNTKTDKRKRS